MGLLQTKGAFFAALSIPGLTVWVTLSGHILTPVLFDYEDGEEGRG